MLPDRERSQRMNGYVIDDDLATVDWTQLTADLKADDFDNRRTPDELHRSFAASTRRFARVEGDTRVVAKARLITDHVCNAYVIDVWTMTAHRRQGLATALMNELLAMVEGQHVALFTDSAQALYATLGFTPQAVGMSKVVGRWLNRYDPRPPKA